MILLYIQNLVPHANPNKSESQFRQLMLLFYPSENRTSLKLVSNTMSGQIKAEIKKAENPCRENQHQKKMVDYNVRSN